MGGGGGVGSLSKIPLDAAASLTPGVRLFLEQLTDCVWESG